MADTGRDPGTTPDPDEERVRSRARKPLAEEDPVDDPEKSARALLEDSDARQEQPATRDLDDPRVIRRTSEETTPPVDEEETPPVGEEE
jgi:hypothetical protein